MANSGWKANTHYLLGALLFLFYANFIFLFASYKGLFYLCFLALVAKFVVDRQLVLDCVKGKSARWFLWMPIFLLVLAILPFEWMEPGKKSTQNLLFSGLLYTAILVFLAELDKQARNRVSVMICTLFIVGIGYHFYGTILVDSLASNFSNSHYAAQFCLTAVFVLSYYLLKDRRAIWLILWLPCMLMAGWVLINTLSRPAWLALIVSIGLACLFIFDKRYKVMSLVGLVFFSVTMYFILPDFFSKSIDDLVQNIANEERVQIWSDGFRMQLEEGFGSWIIGHGPGSYVSVFESYNTLETLFFFPHNFIMELLFESGLLGLIVVICFYIKLYWDIWLLFVNKPSLKFGISTLFLCITVNLLFAFFTFPFYSKYVILYQIPFIAIATHLVQRRCDSPLEKKA